MNIPTGVSVSAAGVQAGAMATPGGAQDPNVKAIQAAMESCAGKTVMSGVMGFGMGGVLGLFMASMAYDTPFGGPGSPNTKALSTREQIKVGFKDMGTRSYSTAKSFGKIGALFAGIECGIEGLRAKNDIGNGAASGCLTGAILAKNSGPQGMMVGCAGFAAFSTAIELWMRQPKDE